MKIVVIDGKGGRLGGEIVAMVKANFKSVAVYGIGTNGIATSQMMKCGADFGATGENSVVVNCRDAKIVIAPIGAVVADSFIGEVTAKMAVAVGESAAVKIFIPNNQCNHYIVGVKEMTIQESILAVKEKITQILNSNQNCSEDTL
ncbi:MAG: DUF3842 family protein [Clostridia bacterium]